MLGCTSGLDMPNGEGLGMCSVTCPGMECASQRERLRTSDPHLTPTSRIFFSGRWGPFTEVGGEALPGIVLLVVVAGPVSLTCRGHRWNQQPVQRD